MIQSWQSAKLFYWVNPARDEHDAGLLRSTPWFWTYSEYTLHPAKLCLFNELQYGMGADAIFTKYWGATALQQWVKLVQGPHVPLARDWMKEY